MSFPTYSPDLDLQILKNTPYSELVKVCETNNYLKQICNREEFWLELLERDYPGLYEGFLTVFSAKITYSRIYGCFDNFNKIVKTGCFDMDLNEIRLKTYNDDDEKLLFTIRDTGRVGVKMELILISKYPGRPEIQKEITYHPELRTIVDDTDQYESESEYSPEFLIVEFFQTKR